MDTMWRRGWWVVCCALAGIALPVAALRAATYEWTNPTSGTYSTAGNWTLTSGSGTPPPVAGDTALLNEAGTYTITLNANAASDVLTDTAGTVTLASNSITPRTYNLTTGGADASITGSSTRLNIGGDGLPMIVNVGDGLTVQSGGTVSVAGGSTLSATNLIMGTSGSGLTSTLIVDGVSTNFNKTSAATTTLGQNGATGVLTIRNNATADINGTLFLTSSGIDTSAASLNVQSQATLQLDSLLIGASNTSAVAHGDVTVTGSGSSITQTGSSTLTIGTAAGNIGHLSINSSGTFNSGTGAITVNATGTVAITGGTFTAKGNMTLNGQMTRDATGTFTLAAGKTLTIQSGGSATFTGNYTNDTASTIAITGGTFSANGNMTFNGQMTRDSAGTFTLTAGKTLTVQNGGDAIFTGSYTTNGSNIAVTGAGSTFNTTSDLGINGGSAMNITSGGAVSSGSGEVTIGISGNGTSTVDGSGSSFGGGTLFIGSLGNTGSLTFSNSSSGGFLLVRVGDSNVAGSNGTLTIQSGATVTGTALNLASQGISFGAGSTGTVTITDAGSALTITGTGGTNIGASRSNTATLNVQSGGAFTSGTGNVFLDRSGTMNIDGGSVTLRGPLNSIGGALNFNSGALSIIDNFTVGTGGRLGADVTFDATRSFTTTATTTIDASHTLALSGGTFNTGNLIVNGTFTFTSGTLGITGAGGLTIGSGGPLGGSFVLGTSQALHVTNTLTVNSGADLTVHSVAPGGFSVGSLVNNGDLVVINSAVSAPVVNNNAVTVVGSVDFNGPVSGPGNFYGPGTAHFNGGMSPGASPDETSFEGNVALGSGNTLFIELGGTTKGTQYDALDVAGSATLAGIVDVSLINGFTPTGGQQFTILAAGSIVNNGLALAAADAGLFNLIVGSTSVILQVIGAPGDYNQNGIVDAADYVVWRKNQGTNNTLPNDLIGGTIGSAQFNQWRAHFGQTIGSGAGTISNAAVPEPATSVLLMFAAAGWCLRRGRAA